MDGFVYEMGPFSFEYSDGGTWIVGQNPNAWTKVANVIYLDSPAGVGMSYSETPADYNVDDTRTAQDSNSFLRSFFERYPQFQKNPFFIAGESFGGIYVPMLTREVVHGNEAGQKPLINLKGYLVGNGCTDVEVDNNAYLPFAVGMSLMSRASYDTIMEVCQGNPYKHRDDPECNKLQSQALKSLYASLNIYDILEPCLEGPPGATGTQVHSRHSFKTWLLHELNTLVHGELKWPLGPVRHGERVHNWKTRFAMEAPCLDYWTAEDWFNSEEVRQAVHAPAISETGVFRICTDRINYTHNVASMIPIHEELVKEHGLHALIYSGDHDMAVPHTGSEKWIYGLELPVTRDWEAWVDSYSQVAGYTVEFGNMVFTTIKGAGHMVPQYKPKQAFLMFSRFLEKQSVHSTVREAPVQ